MGTTQINSNILECHQGDRLLNSCGGWAPINKTSCLSGYNSWGAGSFIAVIKIAHA
jgi:hypothetical protein